MMRQTETNDQTRDLAAFIALSLCAIFDTIDVTVLPWEKRGYWVKADHFRLQWDWSEQLGDKMETAVLADDWPTVAITAGQVAEKLKDVKVPTRHRLGTPWVGAWNKLREKKGKRISN
jgi:hypothetical protein